ncbi:MAG: hypothetical protein AMXMBFR81_03890 [Chthonomonas sp.]
MHQSQRLSTETTGTERMLGATAHVLSIFAPIYGPFLMWLAVRKNHRFAAAHALRAMWDELILKGLLLVAGTASLVMTIQRLMALYADNWQGFNIWDFAPRILIGWVLVAVLGAITTVVSVGQAVSAANGKWPSKRAERRAALDRGS